MNNLLRLFIPSYFVLYGIVCFFWRWAVFRKQTGKNPIILGDSDTPHGYVGLCFKAVMVLITIEVISFAVWPNIFEQGPLADWQLPGFVKLLGFFFLFGSLTISAVAQFQMGQSWRVGIETREKTSLIYSGLYKYSRNPIYVGMMLGIFGLFCLLPNTISLIALVLGYVLLQLIVRLEEAHLSAIQGPPYKEYCQRVRRWL